MNIDFREPDNIQELDSIFRLRHLVYSTDPLLCQMVPENGTYDINQFDLNALHFAAFENNAPIACIRITTPDETHFTELVKEIIASQNLTLYSKNLDFPFQSYYPDANWSKQFIRGMQGRKTGEVGKLAIHPNYRKSGIVLQGLISSFIDYCKNEQNFESGFGSCSLLLERYYRKFGFKLAEGSRPFIHGALPEAVIVRFDKELMY